jgi:hypothetical protein
MPQIAEEFMGGFKTEPGFSYVWIEPADVRLDIDAHNNWYFHHVLNKYQEMIALKERSDLNRLPDAPIWRLACALRLGSFHRVSAVIPGSKPTLKRPHFINASSL